MCSLKNFKYFLYEKNGVIDDEKLCFLFLWVYLILFLKIGFTRIIITNKRLICKKFGWVKKILFQKKNVLNICEYKLFR